MKLKNMFMMAVLVMVIFLTGCNNGGGGGSTHSNQSANGIWVGTLVDNKYGNFDLMCFIHSGEIIAISEIAGRVYKGTYNVSGDNFSGHVKAYEIGGGLVDSGSVKGTLVEKVSLNVNFQSKTTNGSVSLKFDELYDRDSALSYIEGRWRVSDGSYGVTMVIDSYGVIKGSDTENCRGNGLVSILDPDYNMYGVDLDITQCGPYNGSYDGLAVLGDYRVPNDVFFAVVSGPTYLMVYGLQRQ
jgi:hypothetical protein